MSIQREGRLKDVVTLRQGEGPCVSDRVTQMKVYTRRRYIEVNVCLIYGPS